MAGDWIKMRIDLADDPAVIEMAEELGISEHAMVGYLHAIWSWASKHCNAGSVTGVTLVTLGRVTRCEGVPEVMAKVGWLKEQIIDGRSVLIFPKWDRHNSQSAKRRELTRERVRKHREEKCNAASVTSALPEKRREEKRRKNNNPPLPPLPESLDCEEFRAAWSDWQRHRREIRKPLTPTCIRQQLAKMAEWGPQRAIAAMRHTIAMGWQGLREPEERANARRGSNHQQQLASCRHPDEPAGF